MRRIDWSSLDASGRKATLARPARRGDAAVVDGVRAIMEDVQARGGAAVPQYKIS